ncbi:MAG: VIT domain-containing protein [Pseudomonadota bacterium]|nr:VIT domain-containing protein [Pseudomonadota bacterium]
MTPTLTAQATPDPRGLGGLVALVEGVERPLPLRDVRVRARVAGDCARIEVEQRYANPYDVALEAVHLFPLPENGAVIAMELRAGDLVVRADCRERKEAEATFAAAREAGHRAALLTAERADIHTLRVTNLPPRTEVVVRLVVIERLETVDGRTQLRFPTTIAPRYLPGTPIGHTGPGILPDTDHVPDASRLQPPVLVGGGAKLDLEVHILGAVRTVESSLHVAKVTLDDHSVRVAPQGGATVDRDFILTWTTAVADRTEARAFTDGAYTLVVVDPPGSVLPTPIPRDAVFVVDISGSMDGGKMEAAKRALISALHGLLPGDRFRIVAFDDKVEHFRKTFAAYDDASLVAADAWVARLAPRGGTEMLPAIQSALEGDTPAGRLRTVLFITDGQAHNEVELVAAVANRRGTARFFSLGIDTAVNGALLGRLARVGGGTCELCAPTDDIEAVIARIEARFGMPLAEAVRIEGGEAAGPLDNVLFSGRPVTVLLRGAPATVRISGRTSGGPLEATVTPTPIDFPLGPLWARVRVADLEDRLALRPFEEEALRGEILRVALEHHIASRFTAFVAVETSSRSTGERVEVVQPAMVPHGWGPAFAAPPGVGGGGGAPRGMPAPAMGARRMAMAPPPPQMVAESASRSGDYDVDGNEDALFAAAPSAAPSRSKASNPLKRALNKMVDSVRGSSAAPARPAPASPAPAGRFERADAASPPQPKAAAPEPGAELAGTQSADGSYGGDVHRTASALLALVLLGNTRIVGLRKRAVLKAAAWLAAHAADPHASVALAALNRKERGDDAGRKIELQMLVEDTPEGRILGQVMIGASA